MSISRQFTIWCDEPDCDDLLEVDAINLTWARVQWREARWHMSLTADYCYKHAKAHGIKVRKPQTRAGIPLHMVGR